MNLIPKVFNFIFIFSRSELKFKSWKGRIDEVFILLVLIEVTSLQIFHILILIRTGIRIITGRIFSEESMESSQDLEKVHHEGVLVVQVGAGHHGSGIMTSCAMSLSHIPKIWKKIESNWVEMSRNESIWFNMNQIESKRVKKRQKESKWAKMSQNESK